MATETTVRIGRYFSNSAQFWLDLQNDIVATEREKGIEIAKCVRSAERRRAIA